MNEPEADKTWKLKLRYGQLKTAYSHYTVLAEGVVGELSEGFSCRRGPAWMGMKTWASSSDESADMIRAIGAQIGFTVTGRIHVYRTEPKQPPPRDNPSATTSISHPSARASSDARSVGEPDRNMNSLSIRSCDS